MLIKGKNYKTVFIMGAGATRGAVGHVRLNGKMLKPPLNGDFFKVAEAFALAHGAQSVQAKRLKRLRTAFEHDLPVKGDPKMEEAFSLLYMAKDFPEIYKSGPGRKPQPGLRGEIGDFLKLLFPILVELDRLSDDNGYDRLVSRLGEDDTIITLNYDTLLDSALVRHGWNPAKGYRLVGGARKVEWKPMASVTGQVLRDVSVLKLHGSLNWWVKGSLAKISRIFDSKPVRVTNPRRNEVKHHLRQIVPPIYGKVFGHSHWRKLWEQAYKALLDAEALVVIGCSLVDTDFHLSALLRRVAASRKASHRFKRTFFVDIVRVRRRWAKLMKGSFVKSTGYKRYQQFLAKECKA